MNFETLEKLKRLIHALESAAYSQGCADEQDNWTLQKKWDMRTQKLREEIINLLNTF